MINQPLDKICWCLYLLERYTHLFQELPPTPPLPSTPASYIACKNICNKWESWRIKFCLGYIWIAICSGKLCHRYHLQHTQGLYLSPHTYKNNAGNSGRDEPQHKIIREYASSPNRRHKQAPLFKNPRLHLWSRIPYKQFRDTTTGQIFQW